MISWTLSCLDAEIGRIEESIVGTLGDASVFDIGKGLVDEIIQRTGDGAGSICIKRKLSKGTVLKAFFRRRLCVSGRVCGTD